MTRQEASLGTGPPGRWPADRDEVPFAELPPRLRTAIDELLAKERRAPDTGPDRPRPERPRRRLSLAGLLSEHRALVLAAALLVLVTSAFSQAGPRLVDLAITDGMLSHRSFGVVVVATVLYLCSAAVSAGAQRSLVRATGRMAASVMHELRVRVFAHLQRLGIDFYTRERAGVIMARMTSDVENLQVLLQDGLVQFAVQGLTVLVITALLFQMNARLALAELFVMAPPLLVLSLWFRRATRRGYGRVRDGIASVLAHLTETLDGIRLVTAHNRQPRCVARHRRIVDDYRHANDYTARVSSVFGPAMQLLGYVGQAVLLAIGGRMVQRHQLSPGDLVAFFLYVGRLLSPIQVLGQQYNLVRQGQSSVVKLRALLETVPSVADAPDAAELRPVRGEIVLENVAFGYEPGVPVLHGIDLRIEPGETVALVGPTGAGKSTIAKLMCRLYDPTSGRVLIDGRDVRDVELGSLRRQVGVVPQEPFLFAGTFRQNVAFGAPGASDEELRGAVAAVGLLDPATHDGLETLVRERGHSLSAGERQLLALARAFLSRPRVILLDEATAHLDLVSEAKVDAALDLLLEGRTALVIAHRLSTAMKADRIVVLEEGRIVESGTPLDLIRRGGHYARMYAGWAREPALA